MIEGGGSVVLPTVKKAVGSYLCCGVFTGLDAFVRRCIHQSCWRCWYDHPAIKNKCIKINLSGETMIRKKKRSTKGRSEVWKSKRSCCNIGVTTVWLVVRAREEDSIWEGYRRRCERVCCHTCVAVKSCDTMQDVLIDRCNDVRWME